ncbi:hypothetical protein AB0C77_06740 [Streptomyces sp. NPDC048629]|uniref:hypothetical protein n=1 Tax=Streptomyces sp. NPDC048629 TaxID=3154824 RepID=UPI0034276E15
MPEVPELATWWDKVSAIGTAGAVIVALFLAVSESRRRRLDQADADAAQARMITARRKSLSLVVDNHSLYPLLELELITVVIEEVEGRRLVPHLGTGPLPVAFGVIAPGAAVSVTLGPFTPEGETEYDAPKQLLPTDRIRSTYRFTDAQGIRWERTDLQQPKRLLDPTPSLLNRLAFWRR